MKNLSVKSIFTATILAVSMATLAETLIAPVEISPIIIGGSISGTTISDSTYINNASSLVITGTISASSSITAGTQFNGPSTGLTGTAPSLTAGTVTTDANLTGPITSVGNATSIASKQGNTTTFQMSTGATTTNDCVKFDANGNTVDAGAACGAGGGGMVYPASGIASSNGTSWNAAPATTGSGSIVLSNAPTFTGTVGGITAAMVGADVSGAAATAQGLSLQKSSNLSDLASAATARTNLGLGTAATTNSTAYDVAGAASAVTTTTIGAIPLNGALGTPSSGTATNLSGTATALNIGGNSATATALAAAGTTCSAGNFATGVLANGNATGCATPAGTYSLPTATSSTLGGVKPDGTTITNSSGAISVTYGTTSNTAAQGNDSRITGAVQSGGALGTPSSGTITNLTGTAAGATVGNATAAVTATNVAGGTSGQAVIQTGAGATGFLGYTSAATASTLIERDASNGASANITGFANAYVIPANVGGTSDAITLAPVPAITAYTEGQEFIFDAKATNTTGTATLQVSGLATPIYMYMGSVQLPVGGLVSGQLYRARIEGTGPYTARLAPYDTVSSNGDTINGKLFILPADSLELGVSNSATGTITMRGSGNANYTKIQSGATGNWTMVLPVGSGTNHQTMHTNGSGVTSWAAVDLANDVTGTLPVGGGGTGVTSAQGNGTKVQMSSGTATSGHCVQFDANGNTVDAGGTCTTGGGGGTVNSGAQYDLAYYATAGTAVSQLATANSGVLVTSGAGVPSIATTLPSGLSIPSPTVTTPTVNGYTECADTPSIVSGAVTISNTTCTFHKLSMVASTTVTLPAPIAGQSYTVLACANGAWTPTFTMASGTLAWPAATAPTATATNGKCDLYEFAAHGTTYLFGSDGGRNFTAN
jgi:hypothetical protein